VHLALFGKHPAWRDFVAINPAADDLLSATYEDVYCRCLGALQSGVWGPDPGAVVPHFHHAVVRLWPAGDAVVGILVGSVDGLNRHQPLMLAACCRGVCYHRAIPCLLPAVTELARRLRRARDETAVTDLLRASADEFTALIQGTPEPSSGHPADLLRSLLCEPGLAGPGEELHRIVYQMIGHDAGVLVGPWETPRGLADRLPVQARLAIHSPEPAEAIEQWLTFARFLCGRGERLTLFASLGRTWADLIVGIPTETELAAILRLPEGEQTAPADGAEVPAALLKSPEPLTQCVPFNLDDDFRARVSTLRQEALAPPAEPVACLEPERSRVHDMTVAAFDMGERVQTALGRFGEELSLRDRLAAALGGEARLRVALWLLAGTALLALACLFVWWALRAGPEAGAHGCAPLRLCSVVATADASQPPSWQHAELSAADAPAQS
jgi:hypothetical protein